jgi:hypothetical protein
MKLLTQRNYDNLPEIKKRKEEEKKTKELQDRKKQSALYVKELDERRRAFAKKRQTSKNRVSTQPDQ